jgi:hypothetical protein
VAICIVIPNSATGKGTSQPIVDQNAARQNDGLNSLMKLQSFVTGEEPMNAARLENTDGFEASRRSGLAFIFGSLIYFKSVK